MNTTEELTQEITGLKTELAVLNAVKAFAQYVNDASYYYPGIDNLALKVQKTILLDGVKAVADGGIEALKDIVPH